MLYEVITSEAKAAAETKTYFGLQGYLVTILFPEEAQLAGEQAAGAGWIGGSDAQTEGVWKWVTGPEAGTVFWNGGPNGSTPNYANWNSGEPNNCCGGEDYAHITYNVGINRITSYNVCYTKLLRTFHLPMLLENQVMRKKPEMTVDNL